MSITIDEINNFQADIARLKDEKFTIETQYALKCARVEFLEELIRRIGKRLENVFEENDGSFSRTLCNELELIKSITQEIEG